MRSRDVLSFIQTTARVEDPLWMCNTSRTMFNPFARKKQPPVPSFEQFARGELLKRSISEAALVGSGRALFVAMLGPYGCGANDVLQGLQAACNAQPGLASSSLVSSPPASAHLRVDSTEQEWSEAGLHTWFDFILGSPFPLRFATASDTFAWNPKKELVLQADALLLIVDARESRLGATVELLENVRAELAENGRNLNQMPHVFASTYAQAADAVPSPELSGAIGIAADIIPLAYPNAGVDSTLRAVQALVRAMPKKA